MAVTTSRSRDVPWSAIERRRRDEVLLPVGIETDNALDQLADRVDDVREREALRTRRRVP